MSTKKKSASADVSVPPSGGDPRFAEPSSNPLHNEDALSRMSDEGSPNEVTSSIQHSSCLVLLSSMLIVSDGQTSLAQIDGTRIGGVLRQDIVRDAIVWMDSQMPGYLFHRDMIRGASQLRYGARPDESVSAHVTA